MVNLIWICHVSITKTCVCVCVIWYVWRTGKLEFDTKKNLFPTTDINDNVIAMGYPAKNFEGIYRNHIDDVKSFLAENHNNNNKIYNLCGEKKYQYDSNTFQVSIQNKMKNFLSTQKQEFKRGIGMETTWKLILVENYISFDLEAATMLHVWFLHSASVILRAWPNQIIFHSISKLQQCCMDLVCCRNSASARCRVNRENQFNIFGRKDNVAPQRIFVEVLRAIVAEANYVTISSLFNIKWFSEKKPK